MKITKLQNKEITGDSIIPNKDRRTALTGMIVSGAAVTLWHKPVINSVMLPAHAQASAVQDFFATVASASAITVNANIIIDALIPSAYAADLLSPSAELPLADLVFEAEAISQGGGMYAVKIAAEEVPDDKGSLLASRDFVFGWVGTITGLNANSTFTATGCAQAEDVKITAIAASNMTIQMSYFSKTIQLDLVDGSAALPTFPLPCN